ncbi:amidase family protein [Nocardia sp. KC 131]|uniref:amidase family protein n=1 Tax=Nocardia arseniciresistens TaxID=3392119 RepID=UPI00398ECB65
MRAVDMSAALRAGRVTATQVAATAAELARAPRSKTGLITATDELAREQAEHSQRRHNDGSRRSALDGVPIVWKDLFDIRGTITTCGSATRAESRPAEHDSHLVRQAHGSGLITIGKTNLSEFAFSGLGINSHFGTPINPLDPRRVPGGSSAGSAVAVAAGVVPLAVGTDTSGSVRVPAAYCGIVGYRATRGRYGPHDFAPLSPTLDSIGTFATTVEDVIAFDEVITGRHTPRPCRAPVFIVPLGEWSEDTTPDIDDQFASVVAELRSAGAQIVGRRLPSLSAAQALLDTHGTIVGAEAFLLHHRHLDHPLVEAATRRRLTANASTATTIEHGYAAMSTLRQSFAAELDGAALLCPTVRHPPPMLAPLEHDAGRYDRANTSTLRTTMLLSYLGTCGITIPAPITAPGTRAGILLSRPGNDDNLLLSEARWTESVIEVAKHRHREEAADPTRRKDSHYDRT